MRNNIILRLTTYYLAVILVVGGLFQVFPKLAFYMAQERARQGGRAELEFGNLPNAAPAAVQEGIGRLLDPASSVPILLSLFMSLAVVLPVAWVYRWTRPKKRYDQSFLQTLIVIPIAITLVVFLVKGSMALAFSLAGIVAAVRFRADLDEPMDAVYMFLVIGTGLAAGVQLLVVALLASIIFNAVTLYVWRANYGAEPVAVRGWTIDRRPPTGIVAGSSVAAAATETREAAEVQPFNALLEVHTNQVDKAQRAVIAILEKKSKRWQLARVIAHDKGTAVIHFNVRVKKSMDWAAFAAELERCAPGVITKAELSKANPRNL
jgi:hypothetical protein